MANIKETLPVGGVFHLKEKERVIVSGGWPWSAGTEVEITCEGVSRTRGNRFTFRVRASKGMKIRVAKGEKETREGGRFGRSILPDRQRRAAENKELKRRTDDILGRTP